MINNVAEYDVIVAGAGHAGCEAALASSRMGKKTLLITLRLDRIAWMSCNPSVGGIGKSHIVKEVDALGGEMAKNTDRTAIQIRKLNMSKGPAVRATRAQCDMELYSVRMREVLGKTKNLGILEDMVLEVLVENCAVRAVKTLKGYEIASKAVVLTTGTFLNGLMHIGEEQIKGGRRGEQSVTGLTESLQGLGLRTGRLKTGTPPRLDGNTIDFKVMELQNGDPEPQPFSFFSEEISLSQMPCHITYTNTGTHRIIMENLHRAPLFTGQIKSRGPRYCPSIEDKVVRFSDRARHQIFIEPEGLTSDEYYPNGISTSFPKDVQEKIVHSIKGLEDAKILKYAYAVEYDFVFPEQIDHTLMAKGTEGLFLAGQINGTTGYEEAAGQGMIAGINAALRSSGEEPFILQRDEAYIGVMIDDLVTRGVTEPYRMFTSRAEYRLALREDNADERLISRGHRLGIVSDEDFRKINEKYDKIKETIQKISAVPVNPNEETNKILEQKGMEPVTCPATLEILLRRKGVTCDILSSVPGAEFLEYLDRKIKEKVEIHVKYAGYLVRQEEQIKRFRKLEDLKIPSDIDFSKIPSLSNEMKEKMALIRPVSIGHASRIPGITPGALNAMLVHLKKLLCIPIAFFMTFFSFIPVSSADLFTMFGAGSQSISLAGGGSALSDDYSALFNCPAGMAFGQQSLGVGFVGGINQLGIRLSERPSGYDPSDLGEASPVIPYKYRLTKRHNPSRPPDVLGFEIGTTISPFYDWVKLGVLAYVPLTGLGRQYTYFADEREQYFSNTLHYELYGEQLISQQVFVGASVQPLKWLALGLGFRLMPSSKSNVMVLLPNTVDQTQQEMNLRVETGFHLGAIAGIMTSLFEDRFRFAFTFRDKIDMSFKGKTEVQMKGFEDTSEYPFYQPVSFMILFLPRQVAYGAGYKSRYFKLTLDLTWSQWSEYTDNHDQPAGFQDTINYSIGGEYMPSQWFKLRGGFGFHPSPVPPQTERTNYIDNDIYIIGLGAVFNVDVYGKNLEINVFSQFQFASDLQTVKNVHSQYPSCAAGEKNLCDEVPDDLKDPVSGKVIEGASGLQTGNPGWPGFSSGGWIGLTGVHLVWRY
jgi:tRNA uridine 5-carboxymethylaminomethyl modification enzyme